MGCGCMTPLVAVLVPRTLDGIDCAIEQTRYLILSPPSPAHQTFLQQLSFVSPLPPTPYRVLPAVYDYNEFCVGYVARAITRRMWGKREQEVMGGMRGHGDRAESRDNQNVAPIVASVALVHPPSNYPCLVPAGVSLYNPPTISHPTPTTIPRNHLPRQPTATLTSSIPPSFHLNIDGVLSMVSATPRSLHAPRYRPNIALIRSSLTRWRSIGFYNVIRRISYLVRIPTPQDIIGCTRELGEGNLQPGDDLGDKEANLSVAGIAGEEDMGDKDVK
ncbi:hypothetical protein BDQ17DRAFT_1548380 [Cyathus striatus]|nr:hypothetical protein BDQ17DRAFT_1548380 [Cyathus striatus]